MRKSSLFKVCLLCTLVLFPTLVSGCSNGSSDALSVIQSNDNAQIAGLQSALATAQATITAVGTLAMQLTLAQENVSALQTQASVSQLNNSAGPAAPDSQTTPAGQNQALPTNAAASTPIGTPNGFALDTPVTAKALDSSGCAINPVTTFSASDTKIWVVAKAHNLKKGEVFTASWNGTITHQDSWTANYTAVVTCVHFYVQPQMLSMGAGDWTVTLSAADAPGGSTTFTLQGVQPAATSQASQ